jgi:hypothetical protein
MKNKLFFSGIIGVLLIFALVLGCSNGTTEVEMVTETIPGTHTQGPPTYVSPSPEPVGPPAKTFSELLTNLVSAQDAIKGGALSALVDISGDILLPGNETITVGRDITLRILPGGTLNVNGNGILFIQEGAAVEVKGDLYFEDHGNGDDVRQTKLEGKLIVDGGTLYDKSPTGHLLQYVTAIRESDRLVFAGGVDAQGATREINLLGGTPEFTGKDAEGNIKAEIRLKFAGGWTRSTPVDLQPGETILTKYADESTPYFDGIEVAATGADAGVLTVTDGNIVVADREPGGLPPPPDKKPGIRFYVGPAATLRLEKKAVLMAESAVQAQVPASFVVQPGGAIDVSGRLYLAAGQKATNLGTITVKNGGWFMWDDITKYPAPNTGKFGKMVFEAGSSFSYDRAAPKLFLSGGPAGEITTDMDTVVTLTDDSITFTGAKGMKSVIRKNDGVTALNTQRQNKMIVETFVGLKLTGPGAAIPVKELKSTGALADTLSIEGATDPALLKLTVTKGKININAAAHDSLKTNGAKLDLLAKVSDTDASPKPPTATIASSVGTGDFTLADLAVDLINTWEESYVNYKGFVFTATGATDWNVASGLSIHGMSFDKAVISSAANITFTDVTKPITFGGGLTATGRDITIGDPAAAAVGNKINAEITFNGAMAAANLVISGVGKKITFNGGTTLSGTVEIKNSYAGTATAKATAVSFGETKEADPVTKLITPKKLTVGAATVDIENSYVTVEDAEFSNAAAIVKIVRFAFPAGTFVPHVCLDSTAIPAREKAPRKKKKKP